MNQITVRTSSGVRRIEAEPGDTVLDALQQAGVKIDAPCGGAGKCMKCRVLISDENGVSYHLACQTPATDGIDVSIEDTGKMLVSMESDLEQWPADGIPGNYGLAADVGTTTVVCRLYDLSTGQILDARGCSNPQLAYGADVLSRISASTPKGIKSMAALLGEALRDMAREMVLGKNLTRDQISFSVIVANTTMQTLAVGLDPSPIGVSPFTPPSLFGDVIEYHPFELEGFQPKSTLFAACIDSYVGGDITAGILAVRMVSQKKYTFLLDLGTNGEMALGNEDAVVTCATAAGPVFEGANIKYGMPAYPGAIAVVEVGDEPGTLKLTVIDDADPVGVCGTGLFDAVAIMLKAGIIDDTGRILALDEIDTAKSHGLEKLIVEDDGQPAFKLTDRINITQKDVRSLQLAKAAISAGMLTLMEKTGTKMDDIGQLLIAGGFGQHLSLKAAAIVGLFPMELLHCAKSVGNTAIEGAGALLVSSQARKEMIKILDVTTYVELSVSPEFNEFYIDEMEFSEAIV